MQHSKAVTGEGIVKKESKKGEEMRGGPDEKRKGFWKAIIGRAREEGRGQ